MYVNQSSSEHKIYRQENTGHDDDVNTIGKP